MPKMAKCTWRRVYAKPVGNSWRGEIVHFVVQKYACYGIKDLRSKYLINSCCQCNRHAVLIDNRRMALNTMAVRYHEENSASRPYSAMVSWKVMLRVIVF